MANNEVSEQPPRRHERPEVHPTIRGSETPQTDGLKQNWPNIEPVDKQLLHMLTDSAGKGLHNPADRAKLEGFVEGAMKGDLRKLAELADPKNEKAANAFASLMDKLGYSVTLGKAGDDRPYNSVDIVSKKDAATVGGQGIELRQMPGTNSYRAYATQNEDGSVSYPSNPATLHKLRDALAKRVGVQAKDVD